MRTSCLFTLAICLAGQALALNITIGSTNYTASDLLNFGVNNNFVDSANCSSQCSPAAAKIQSCSNDDHCLCTNDTGVAMLNCEQCLFTYTIEANIRPPSPLIGSQPALTAFGAACLAPPLNTTIQALKMVLPANWDGPESNKLGLGATVVAVAAGAILGGGSLYILTNVE